MTTRLALLGLAALAACGGSDSAPGGGGTPLLNRYTGTITVSSALPAGTGSCVTTQTVSFNAAGVSTFQVTVPGGGCVTFTNSDTAPHQPATRNPNPCAALNAPAALAAGQSFTTAPLGSAAGAQACDWQDALNPPTAGGGY